MPLIYLIVGEASGDVLGARLISALRRQRPGLRFAGVGGPRMIDQGFTSLHPMADLAVMGLVEVLPRLRLIRRRLTETLADIDAKQPDILVTIDSPGYTKHVLKQAARRGLKRVQYVAPQVWAWHEKRVRTFPGLWDRLLCLLPFEPAWFAARGIDATFVGHPVLESGAADGDGARFRERHGLAGERILILMPGSRRSEIPRLLPVFEEVVERLARSAPNLRPVLPVSATVAQAVRRATAGWKNHPTVVTDLDDKHDAYAAASVALTKSGTSTLELALAGVPMAVTYRVNPLSAAIARRAITVPHVAMVNLLAGRAVVPELLQERCRPDELERVVLELLADGAAAAAQRDAFGPILDTLRPPEGLPSDAAARQVLQLLDQA
ncbi:MAG: lipid-A-disaccharide synthase [Acetobacteraceae bacterium]|nr:lipid-A-disaccharide synthase [Acetobacteraceae bacterium]